MSSSESDRYMLIRSERYMEGKSLRVKLPSQSLSVRNLAPRRASEILCDYLPEVSPNPASFDNFPVEMSLAAFGIVWGRYRQPALALQMLSGMVWLQPCLLGLPNCRNLHFSCPGLHLSLTDVVGRIPPSWLHQFFKTHLLLLKALNLVLYRFGGCAHQPAWFVLFAHRGKPCISFIIILVFPILLILGFCKIAQTVSDSIQHLLKRYFRLCGCPMSLFNNSHMFLLLHNCCLCLLNYVSCHCSI
jgi:hypothetical protein